MHVDDSSTVSIFIDEILDCLVVLVEAVLISLERIRSITRASYMAKHFGQLEIHSLMRIDRHPFVTDVFVRICECH